MVVERQRGGEREHGREREPVVEPRLEVERVTDDRRHARIRDHAGGQDRIGRGEQRAEQERLCPREVDEHVGGDGDDDRGQRHREHELAQRQTPVLLEHLAVNLEAVAEQDHDQRDGGESPDERRARVEVNDVRAAGSEPEADEDEQRGQRQKAAPGKAGHERANDEQDAEREQGRVKPRAIGREQQRHLHVRTGHATRVSGLREERRGDHGPGQVTGVAGRGGRM